MIQAGWTFHTVILTQGNCLQGEALRKCAEKANGTIGIQRLTIHDFPYNAMDTQPNVYVDIHSTISSKLKALSQYSCEKTRHPVTSTMETIRDFARHWGCSAGWEEAEPFLWARKMGDL